MYWDGSNRIPFPILSHDRWFWGMSYVKSLIEVANEPCPFYLKSSTTRERGIRSRNGRRGYNYLIVEKRDFSVRRVSEWAAELRILRARFSIPIFSPPPLFFISSFFSHRFLLFSSLFLKCILLFLSSLMPLYSLNLNQSNFHRLNQCFSFSLIHQWKNIFHC